MTPLERCLGKVSKLLNKDESALLIKEAAAYQKGGDTVLDAARNATNVAIADTKQFYDSMLAATRISAPEAVTALEAYWENGTLEVGELPKNLHPLAEALSSANITQEAKISEKLGESSSSWARPIAEWIKSMLIAPITEPKTAATKSKARRSIDTPARRAAYELLRSGDLVAIDKIIGSKITAPPAGMIKIIKGLIKSGKATEKQREIVKKWDGFDSYQPKNAFGTDFNGKVAQELHGMLFSQSKESTAIDDWAGLLGDVTNDEAMIAVMSELDQVSKGKIAKEDDSNNPNRDFNDDEIAKELAKRESAEMPDEDRIKEMQDEGFDQANFQGRNEGDAPISADEMVVGQKITVDGEPMTVTQVVNKQDFMGNKEVDYVVLQDGTRFGRQVLEGGEVIYEERESDESPVDQGFNLETQTDEQIKAEEAAAKAKAELQKRQDKRLTGSAGDLTADMFGGGETPLFNENRSTAKVEAAPEQAEDVSPAEIKSAPVEERKEEVKTPITNLTTLFSFFDQLREGKVTADEVKAAWETYKGVENELRKEVVKMTMKELTKFQGMRKPDNKAEAVKMAMEFFEGRFNPGNMLSYGLTLGRGDMNKSRRDAMDKAVSQWTDEAIQSQAQNRKDAIDARNKALENPETLDEWKQFVRRKGLTALSPEEIKAFNAERSPYALEPKIMARGEGRLTPEQLAAYDEVRGIDRKADAQAKKEREATVRGVNADTDSEIIETKHTKTGADLFVVKLADRVEKDVYTSLNSAAKKMGGYYSSYRVGGAVPGFQFKDRATAEQFQAITKGETVDRAEAVQERQAESKNAAAERLNAMADKMEAAADSSLNADRKTNTAKRAREAGTAEASARTLKALSETMRNLASAIESGDATHLDGVRTKTHVETLESLARRAKSEAERTEDLTYAERQKREGEPVTSEQIDKTKYPFPFLNETAWQWLIDNGNNTPGAKRLTARLEKVFAAKPSAKENGSYLTGADMIEVVKELLGKIKKQDYTRTNIEDAFKSYDRVQAMGLKDLPSLRAALRESLQYRGTKAKEDPIKAMERELVGMKIPGFFPTPQTVIEEMLDRVGNLEGKHVLEPSGGKGDIADAAKAAGADVDVIEQQSRLRNILEARGHRVIGWDFMDADPNVRGFTYGDVFQNQENTKGIMRGQGGAGSDRVRLVREDGTEIGKYNRSELEGIEKRGSNSGYDAVLMNPPFEDGQDGEHVQRAFQFLKPGGKLVAITGEGIFSRSDKKAKAFRDWLESVDGTSEKLPEGSFKSAFRPTGVATRIVVVTKPAGTLRAAPLPKAQNSDTEYLAAVEAGDMDTAQRMVDDAAKKSEFNVGPLYHGSENFKGTELENPNKKFTANHSFWFTDDADLAEYYAGYPDEPRTLLSDTQDGPAILRFYIKPHDLELDRRDYEGDGFEEKSPVMDANLWLSLGRNQVIKITNIDDKIDTEVVGDSTVYGIRTADLARSADPVTRDASGNVIPLSQRFDSTKDSILRAAPLPAPFYSQLERSIEAKMPKIAPAPQVLAIAKDGSKAEEYKWSGIEQAVIRLAQENGGKVPKDQLLNYLADEGKVKFTEVTLGDKPLRWAVSDQNETEYFDTKEEAEDAADSWRSNLASEIDRREIVQVGEGWSVAEGDSEYGGSEWALYDNTDQQQEGFDTEEEANARLEELNGMYAIKPLYDDNWVADPRDSYESEQEAEEARDAEDEEEVDGYVSVSEDDSGNDSNAPLFARYVLPGGENYREVVLAMPVGEEAAYTSSHFPDVPNYVAHMRTNERDGGLFIEELQSDRHQAGRKQGYKDESAKDSPAQRLFGKNYTELDSDKKLIVDNYITEYGSPQSENGKIADAPFRNSWPLALFKRALRDAVAGGKTWIGWTVGETQNDRFDLSKSVDAVKLIRQEGDNFSVIAEREGEENTVGSYAKDKLPDVIGKELAAKVDTWEGNPNYMVFRGNDLKVGGSGMKGFYDTMLPKEIGKYVKQWNSKVEQSSLKSKDPIWKVVITDEMRKSVSAGQLLYAAPLPANQELEQIKQRGRADFAKIAPKVKEAQTMIDDFGSGSLGVNPKFANFGGVDQNVRNQVDIVRAADMANHEVREDRDTFAKAKELLAKDSNGVYAMAMEGAYSEGAHLRINDHQQLAIEILTQKLVKEAYGDPKKLQDAQALIWANILNRKEAGRVLRIGFDKFMTPAERADKQLSEMIFRIHPKVEARAKTMTLAQRKAFFQQAGKNRIKEVEAALKKAHGLRLDQVLRQRNEATSKATKLEKEILKLKNVLDQSVIAQIKKGASLKDIQRLYNVAPEKALAVLNEHREAIASRLRKMLQSGMTEAQIIEAEKDNLKAAALKGDNNAMTPEQIEAIIARRMEDYKLPTVESLLKQKALPKTPKAKLPKEEIIHPLLTDWSKPRFFDGLNGFEFDRKDRAGIMDRVEKIRMLAGALGQINLLTGIKQEQAKAALTEINSILSKYGTDAEGILNADKGIESYGFDPTDMVQMAAIARTINQIDADWIDKAMEFLYANMLWGPQTMIVNATASANAVYQMTVGRMVEMSINHFAKDPMSAQFGEVKYILRALKPGLQRATSNFQAAWLAQHPMTERDLLGSEVDWEAHAGGFRNQIKGGVISGKKGDLHRTPLRLLSATDDFNKTLFGMAEAAAFAYRLGVKKSKTKGDKMFGKAPGSPEFERFIKIEMNTPGSFSMRMGVDKASRMIFANALPGQKNSYTGEIEPSNDIGGVIGIGASKLNEFVTSGDHDNIAAKALLAMLRISFFPFQRTPFNIVRQGMRYTPNPISLTDILWGTISNSMQMNEKTGKNQFKWNAGGRVPELIERASMQLQGAAVMGVLMALAVGEGDDDDQDKWLVMTGTSPWSPAKRSQKEARERAGVGAYRISWRTGNGDERAGFSYGRIEPLATALSTTIDTIRTIKRIVRKDGDASDIASNLLGGLVAQTKDKTFMRGFGDLIDLMTNAAAADDVKEPNQRKLNQFIVGKIAMTVPNIIKQPIREADNTFRERSDNFNEELMYQLFPYGQKAAKLDPYGDKMEKQKLTGSEAVDSFARVFDFSDSGKNQVNPVDKMLLKFREKTPEKAWFPAVITNATFEHKSTGKSVKMDGAQLAEFREKAGKLTKAMIKVQRINYENPTEIDVEKVKTAYEKAKSQTKKALSHKFSQTEK